MSGSTDNRASSPAENPPDRPKVFDLALARRMLPLVSRIADDLILSQKQLAALLPEMEQLQRQRRTLPWLERSRLYRLREEVAASEQASLLAQAELAGLGLVLLEPDQARIGFPTFVNNRRAFFSWQPGEDSILYWNYVGDDHRQAIPISWQKQANLTLASRQ